MRDDDSDYQDLLLSSDSSSSDSSDDEPPKRMPAAKKKVTKTSTKSSGTKPTKTSLTTKHHTKQVKMAADPPIDEVTAPLVSIAQLRTRHSQIHHQTRIINIDSGYIVFLNMAQGKTLTDYTVARRRDDKELVDIKSKSLFATVDDALVLFTAPHDPNTGVRIASFLTQGMPIANMPLAVSRDCPTLKSICKEMSAFSGDARDMSVPMEHQVIRFEHPVKATASPWKLIQETGKYCGLLSLDVKND